MTLVEYRHPGQRGSPHRAHVPGEVFDPDTARADLEAVTGPVATVKLVGTVHRDRPGVVASREEPPPLAVPLVALAPFAAIPTDEAWRVVGAAEPVRWAFPPGRTPVASPPPPPPPPRERGHGHAPPRPTA